MPEAPQTKLKRLLSGTGLTVCAAESCTGGMISHLITTVPGSSGYYLGSVTSYSPSVKNGLLGVSYETIATKGIVSSDVAAAMAEGILKLTSGTFSVSTTGWADSCGDEHEPAGTVWVGVSGPHGTKTYRYERKDDRNGNIRAFSAFALKKLVDYISDYISNCK